MRTRQVFIGLRPLAACFAAATLLAGCSSVNEALEGPKIEYKSAGTLPSLEVPPDLTRPTRDDRFAVPPARSATLSDYQADRSQRQQVVGESGVLPRIENIRIERSGSQRWLVVPESAEKLWPEIREFWQENGFLVKVETPEAGVMETDWAENRAKIPQDFIRNVIGRVIEQVYSTAERDKFRTRLERTADGKGTEIYISHRGMEEVYVAERSNETVWQPRKPDPDLEAEFLRRLMVRLGVQEERSRQVVAKAAPAEERAQLSKAPGGAETLEVHEPFDRAWRRVGLALDRIGFTVEDRDRQNGLYFVRYADPQADMDRKTRDKPGLLSRFAFWRSDDPKVKAEQYRVSVVQKQDVSQVQVLGREGGALASQTASRILALLHERWKYPTRAVGAPMLRFASLASGSRGNCLVVEARSAGSATRVLIDCGLGPRQMVRRLRRLGLEPEDISALLITHEHDDHAGGAYAFAAGYRIPLWMTRGTHRALLEAGLLGAVPEEARRFDGQPAINFLDGRSGFALEGLCVQPFTVPHDAREPVQYVLSDGAMRLGVLTDLGAQTAHVTQVLHGCHGLVLECNHDLDLLWAGGYPRWLKERIAGPLGHFDNGAAARLLASLDRARLQHVVAAHLSQQNNKPEYARRALSAAMGCGEDWIRLADQELGFDWLELR